MEYFAHLIDRLVKVWWILMWYIILPMLGILAIINDGFAFTWDGETWLIYTLWTGIFIAVWGVIRVLLWIIRPDVTDYPMKPDK